MAFSRGWHPLAIDVISASMGTGRKEGQLGISSFLAESCIKETPLLLLCTLRSCPCAIPSEFFTPKDILPLPLPSMLPSFLLGWGRDVTPPAGQCLKPAASFVLEILPALLPLGMARKPQESLQSLDVCTASPKLPNFPPHFLPSARVVGSLLSCWLR